MDGKSKAKLTIGALLFFTVFLILAFYTPNPDRTTPNEGNDTGLCEQYDLNVAECPYRTNQTGSNTSNGNTTPVNESVNSSV